MITLATPKRRVDHAEVKTVDGIRKVVGIFTSIDMTSNAIPMKSSLNLNFEEMVRVSSDMITNAVKCELTNIISKYNKCLRLLSLVVVS